ncbi:MAG: hypothetical protein BGO95_10185 [Micrococcales bacterium 73-13]|nr:MAG: hypothetical protein BGO95_10185 [Micrococcales bacterium 73-13]
MARTRDRFDAIAREPGRVGSHRGPIRRGGGWIGLLLFLIGLVVITAAGLFVVDRIVRDTSPTGQGLDFAFPFLPKPTDAATPEPTEAPVVTNDPNEAVARGVRIMIMNGTPVVGLQNTVGDELVGVGWPIATRAAAGDRQVLDTIIYYVDPANADLARGLAEAIGIGEARPIAPNVYPGQDLIIVLGNDHPAVPRPEPAPTDSEQPAG